MALVGNLDIVRQLRQLFQLRGNLPLELGADILPVVNAFNLDEPPYHSKRGFLRSVRRVAAAGFSSGARFTSPTAAATTAVIRYVDVMNGGASDSLAGFDFRSDNPAPLGNYGDPYSWHGGERLDYAHHILSHGDRTYTAGDQHYEVRIGSKQTYRLFGPLVLPPGYALDITLESLATELIVGVYADLYAV